MSILISLSLGILIGATLVTVIAVIRIDELNQGKEKDGEYKKGYKEGYNEAMRDIGG